ncbi:MAG: hypothetical protein QG673_1821, partial [Pseudomonadota bacterium]|nr:hypothetical protein [Pseudomonadota bacterium]
FKIDDESIYETRSNIDDSISHQDTHETFTNGSIAEIKQIVNMLDDIEQGFFHEEYHITFYEVYSAIRHCKYNDFPSIHSDIDDEFRDSYRRGVVNNNLADVPKFNFLEFKAKSSGVRNPSKHSIIFYKLEGEYRILIKPNIQLSEYRRKYDPSKIMGNHPLRIGNSKAVKTLGIEITMSNAKELVSIKQVVTGKLYNPYPEDGITSTDDSYINQMVNDGYGLVMYKKVKVNSSDRVFVQDYLGESLLIHLQLNKFSIEQRLKIIQLHWEKIYFDMLIYHDTKLDNVLLESNKIDKVHVIDFFHMDARYLPHREVFERLTSQKQIEKSHVFQFLYLYYKIYQNDVVCVDSEVDDVDRQELGQINELNLSKGNPFAEPLQRAWRCELEWEECKREVNNILYPHQYVGPVGGGESSFAEPIRIYV